MGVAHELAGTAESARAAVLAYKQALQLFHTLGDAPAEALAANAVGVLLHAVRRPRGGYAAAFSTVNHLSVGLLYGPEGCLAARFGGFRRGQMAAGDAGALANAATYHRHQVSERLMFLHGSA